MRAVENEVGPDRGHCRKSTVSDGRVAKEVKSISCGSAAHRRVSGAINVARPFKAGIAGRERFLLALEPVKKWPLFAA
jgi:hypothetical protein